MLDLNLVPAPVRGRINFNRINDTAIPLLPALLKRWLPDGCVEGHEYVARNPRRADKSRGSFKVNMHTGRWSDFAADARGGDPVSLAAYLADLSQAKAAERLASMLGLEARDA
jgi:hypothetical protein